MASLLTQGMSIAEVAEVLGDTVQEISETYAHAVPDFGKRLQFINASRGSDRRRPQKSSKDR